MNRELTYNEWVKYIHDHQLNKYTQMDKEIKKIIEFVKNPKYSQDSENADYISDGEMIDIVMATLEKLLTKLK